MDFCGSDGRWPRPAHGGGAHGLQGRVLARPEPEGVGGLVDQHPQAVDGAQAPLPGRRQQRGDGGVVHEVDHHLPGAEPVEVDGQRLRLAARW